MNALVKNIIDTFKNTHKPIQDEHTRTTHISPRTSHKQRHFTRSRLEGFLAQSVQQIDKQVYVHHIANQVYHENTGIKQTVDKLLIGKDKDIWDKSLANKFGRLAQGFGKTRRQEDFVQGTNTIFFISKDKVPQGANVTYAILTCDLRPIKTETHQIHITVGGDKLTYDGDPSSPAVSLLNIKIILNSVISDAHKGARFMTADIKKHYL